MKINRTHVRKAISLLATTGVITVNTSTVLAAGPLVGSLVAAATNTVAYVAFEHMRFSNYADNKIRAGLKSQGLPETASNIALIATTLSISTAENKQSALKKKVLCAVYDNIAKEYSKQVR